MFDSHFDPFFVVKILELRGPIIALWARLLRSALAPTGWQRHWDWHLGSVPIKMG
jgi:hypothetical protein